MRCRLLHDQRGITANGTTGFLFTLAPDKSTAYAAYLPPAPWLIDATERLAEPPGLNMPRPGLITAGGDRGGYSRRLPA